MKVEKIIIPAIAGLAVSCTYTPKEPKQETKPNIVVILIDDLGWTDLGCYGSTFYETPNIDQLAKEGMLFTQSYMAASVCSPSRASILTGKYPVNTDITDWIPGRQYNFPTEPHHKLMCQPFCQDMAKEEKTIAEYMKDAGYLTCAVGKWHVAQKYMAVDQGFDASLGVEWKPGPYGGGGGGFHYPFSIENVPGKEGDFLTDNLTDMSIDFIAENKDTNFFMYLSHYSVHHPYQAPDSTVSRYATKTKALDLTDTERYNHTPDWEKYFPEDMRADLKERIAQDDSIYGAMVTNLDQNIGRFIDALKENGIYDNTIILFTSDNGGTSTSLHPTSNYPLKAGKGFLYEGGIRIPTIVKWPGVVEPNTTSDAVVNSIDYLPTILEMSGASLENLLNVDGTSFVSTLKGDNQGEKTYYWHYPHYSNENGFPQSAIRKGNYKLIENFEDASYELYNLKEDIGETRNLVLDMPDKVKELKEMLEAWKVETNAKIPIENPDCKN